MKIQFKFNIDFKYIESVLKSNLQLFGVFYAFSEFYCLFIPIYIGLLIWLLFTPYFYITIIYIIWMIYDRNAYKKGGHLQQWFRRLSIWKYAAEYFTLKLHKTADLDPSKNYIIGYHPHGISGVIPFFHFCAEVTNFSEKFPGITCRLVTINAQYLFPLHRDIISWAGLSGNSKECLEWIINENGIGNAAVIVIGGAQESLDAVPRTMHLYLKNRKGFIKLALKYGASLVPCVSFGDNEMYSHIKFDENSIIRRIQLKLLKSLTFTYPLFYGRGFTENTIGYLPYRKKITTIVGKPINVEKIEKPSQENIDKLHELYIKSLCDLYYTHRSTFPEYQNVEMVIK